MSLIPHEMGIILNFWKGHVLRLAAQVEANTPGLVVMSVR